MRQEIDTLKDEARNRLNSLTTKVDDAISKHANDVLESVDLSSFTSSGHVASAEPKETTTKDIQMVEPKHTKAKEAAHVVHPPNYTVDSSLMHEGCRQNRQLPPK